MSCNFFLVFLEELPDYYSSICFSSFKTSEIDGIFQNYTTYIEPLCLLLSWKGLQTNLPFFPVTSTEIETFLVKPQWKFFVTEYFRDIFHLPEWKENANTRHLPHTKMFSKPIFFEKTSQSFHDTPFIFKALKTVPTYPSGRQFFSSSDGSANFQHVRFENGVLVLKSPSTAKNNKFSEQWSQNCPSRRRRYSKYR